MNAINGNTMPPNIRFWYKLVDRRTHENKQESQQTLTNIRL